MVVEAVAAGFADASGNVGEGKVDVPFAGRCCGLIVVCEETCMEKTNVQATANAICKPNCRVLGDAGFA